MVGDRATVGRIEAFFWTRTLREQVLFVPWTLVSSAAKSARYKVGTHRVCLPLTQCMDAVTCTKEGQVRHVLLPLQWEDAHKRSNLMG